MSQYTRIRIRNRQGNTDVAVVSNGQGDIDIEIAEDAGSDRRVESVPSRELKQVFEEASRQQMMAMMQEFQRTQGLMQAFQEMAASLQGQQQMMMSSMEQAMDDVREVREVGEPEVIERKPLPAGKR